MLKQILDIQTFPRDSAVEGEQVGIGKEVVNCQEMPRGANGFGTEKQSRVDLVITHLALLLAGARERR